MDEVMVIEPEQALARVDMLPAVAVYGTKPAPERQVVVHLVGNLTKAVKSAQKVLEEQQKPAIQEAHAQHKLLTARLAQDLAPWQRAERRLKDLSLSYHDHEEALRREEEKRLREIAMKAEEEARLQEAMALEAAGDQALAEAVLAAPVVAPAPVAPRVIAAPSGQSIRTRWVGEVTDLRAVLEEVIAGKAPAGFVAPVEATINGFARSTKGAVPIRGIRFHEVRDVATRTA